MSETKLRWFKKGGVGAVPVLQYRDIDSWGISEEWKDVPLVIEEEPLKKLGPWPTIPALIDLQNGGGVVSGPDPNLISINLSVEKEVTVGDPYGLR